MHQDPMGILELFAELGLACDYAAIADFVQQHPLAAGVPLVEASFWTPTQREFLLTSARDESGWGSVVLQLDNLLRNTAISH